MPKQPIHRKIIFLINPISGTRAKTELHKKVLAAAAMHHCDAIVLPTVASGDYSFVEQKILEDAFTDIVICGGDGTVNQVVNSLHHTGIYFGIIPMGSGNGLANTAGIPSVTDKAIDLLFSGKPRFIDAFMVNDQFACMLCGIGFDAKVAHDFAQQPGRGLLTYTQQTLKNYFTATPYQFELVVNDQVIQTAAFFISIANSNQFGNQFTIAPKASLNDGLLDIVIVPKMNKAILPFALIQQIRGGKPASAKDSSGTTIQYFQTAKIQIRNKDNAPLHIDGEPRETTKVLNIGIVPRCFQLIQPAS
ncbi:diacylglycerol/lipid kinase family protein [Flavihumibacter profundi]|uniref:diacylglycerol/lipid kinase family protein n=1 Tax=Flavihumibacter profundi TaxID=2716883 RepID=UPI001CC60269|nr:YegS/Rv2252/BmrU family lipid kinase [Flavihumibacter profundi]MBZ5858911.1 YegS/Rv2252/BmrU family lipid kinase [Flavihumibacter profundi]